MKKKLEAVKNFFKFIFNKKNWYKTLIIISLIIIAVNGFYCQTKYFTCSKTKIKLKSEGDKVRPFSPEIKRPEAVVK